MKNVLLVTQGCDKNTVDAEYLAGALAQRGLRPFSPATWREEPLDAVVVNTCGFIDEAKQQSINAVLEWADFKTSESPRTKLIVAGCLAQKFSQDLKDEIPEIDACVGVGAWGEIARLLAQPEFGPPSPIPEPDMRIDSRLLRLPLDREPHRFLKISDGCNQRCTFCAIPSMKGRHRSVPLEILVDEARALLDAGTREICLIAQDLTSYGVDARGGPRLADLLAALDALEGDFWLRLFYVYPARIDDRLIRAIGEARHVVPYLDMPFQHASDAVLRAMRRPGDQRTMARLLARLRAGIPDLALRTTFIVGFPGETEAQFEDLLAFIEEQRFDRVGAFTYQPQEGTPSAAMPGQVPEEVKAERLHRLMMLQREIAEQRQAERFRGRRLRVLVERFDPEVGLWRARSFADGPEVDGTTWVEANADKLREGEFAEVLVTDTDAYDLRATLCSTPLAVWRGHCSAPSERHT